MAFVRRHRLVLVPLFAALMLGVGLVFLLRSQSEEPAGSAEPVLKDAVWEEVVELRDDHTRVDNVIQEVEQTDPVTGDVYADTIVRQVHQVGSGLCYRDASGGWVPSVPVWRPGGLGFKMDRNGW